MTGKRTVFRRILALMAAAALLAAGIPFAAAEPDGAEAITYVLEASGLEAFAAEAKADGDSVKAGTDDFFTILWSAKSKVDSSSKKWDDGYESGQRINFGGKAEIAKKRGKDAD